MSYLLQKYSKFFYGPEIDEFSYTLSIQEDLQAPRVVEIRVGGYTITQLANQLAVSLNTQLLNEYEVSVDRLTRVITISADVQFRILGITGGDTGTTILPSIGFPLSDTGYSLTHSGTSAVGSVYEPQFWLQEYTPSSHWEQSAFSTVNKAASGKVQNQKFGDENFMECSITYITEIEQNQGDPIRTNKNAVSDFLEFMRWLKNKFPVEFMPDESNVLDYETFILESSEASSDGTGFRLRELYDKGLSGYFDSGRLKFRRLD